MTYLPLFIKTFDQWFVIYKKEIDTKYHTCFQYSSFCLSSCNKHLFILGVYGYIVRGKYYLVPKYINTFWYLLLNISFKIGFRYGTRYFHFSGKVCDIGIYLFRFETHVVLTRVRRFGSWTTFLGAKQPIRELNIIHSSCIQYIVYCII